MTLVSREALDHRYRDDREPTPAGVVETYRVRLQERFEGPQLRFPPGSPSRALISVVVSSSVTGRTTPPPKGTYWKLTGEEIEREIALFVISRPNHCKLSLRNAEKGDPATGVRFARHA